MSSTATRISFVSVTAAPTYGDPSSSDDEVNYGGGGGADSFFYHRIASIFIILIGSMFSAMFSVFAYRSRLWHVIPKGVFEYAYIVLCPSLLMQPIKQIPRRPEGPPGEPRRQARRSGRRPSPTRRGRGGGRRSSDDRMDAIRGASAVENRGTAASADTNEDHPPPVIPSLNPYTQGTVQTDNNNTCAACQCELHVGKSVKLDCGSKYDIDCLKRMFEANVNDEYNFPPRCCGRAVPLSKIKQELSKETLDLYEAKLLEYSTPYRLYCSNTNCGRFLGGRRETVIPVKCATCDKETCGFCCAPAHSASQKCKIDKGLRKALKLAQSHGWQRCPRCRQVVERDHGCFHMSCRCGAEFCYLCAADWYECRCRYRRRLFVRLVAMRWMRGNYLLKSEPGAKGHGSVSGFCKRSWKSVVKVVTAGA